MVLTGHGGLEKYAWREDWPRPEPEPMEALIKVGACGLNNTDVNTRTGWYSRTVTEATTGDSHAEVDETDPTWADGPSGFRGSRGRTRWERWSRSERTPTPPSSAGGSWSTAGSATGSDPENLDKTRYFGSEIDGGFAEYTKCDARNVAVVDSGLTDAELATFSCSYTTAEGMLNRANVGAGDTVLVPGASGGVGSALVQLARRRSARVIAMASEAKHAEVARLGPDAIVPRAPKDLRGALRGERVTVVADVVGGSGWPELIDILERGGRYTCSGAIAGPIVRFDLRPFYLRTSPSPARRWSRAMSCGISSGTSAGRGEAGAGRDLAARRASGRPAGVHRQESRGQHRGRALTSPDSAGPRPDAFGLLAPADWRPLARKSASRCGLDHRHAEQRGVEVGEESGDDGAGHDRRRVEREARRLVVG